MELYNRIKARREELGLSQEELAYKLGYKSRSTINKIEMGKNDITQSKIKAFAEALNCSPAYLMGWDNEPQQVSNIDFSERLKKTRKENNIRISELAKILNLSISAIVNFENGRTEPRCNTLLKMSDVFDVDLDYLLGKSDVPNKVLEQIDSPLSSQEKELLKKYNTLNDTGKAKADDYIEDLADNPKYTERKPNKSTAVFHTNSTDDNSAVFALQNTTAKN